MQAKIQILAATIPMQSNASLVKIGTGVFTYALLERFSQAGNLTNGEAMSDEALSNRVKQITCLLNQHCQQITSQLLP